MKVKVSDSLDNVKNENVVTTHRLSDQLLELLEWLFATKNGMSCGHFHSSLMTSFAPSVLSSWSYTPSTV